jgi:hypothetical protein
MSKFRKTTGTLTKQHILSHLITELQIEVSLPQNHQTKCFPLEDLSTYSHPGFCPLNLWFCDTIPNTQFGGTQMHID